MAILIDAKNNVFTAFDEDTGEIISTPQDDISPSKFIIQIDKELHKPLKISESMRMVLRIESELKQK